MVDDLEDQGTVVGEFVGDGIVEDIEVCTQNACGALGDRDDPADAFDKGAVDFLEAALFALASFGGVAANVMREFLHLFHMKAVRHPPVTQVGLYRL